MKKLLLVLLAIASFYTQAQQTVLFHENFDLPSGPDSVSVNFSGSNTNPTLWNDTNFVSVSPNQSYHLKGSPNSSVHFETQSFSTLGTQRTYLKFSHICKVASANQCRIFISNNNGASWINVGPSSYLGSSLRYAGGFQNYSFFNESSYNYGSYQPDIWKDGIWLGTNALINNHWWVTEYFDISYAAKGPGVGAGYSNVKIKFVGNFGSNSSTKSQWFIDDVQVISSPCDIFYPLIEPTVSSPSSCSDSILKGPFRNLAIALPFNETRTFTIYDNEPIDSVRFVEFVNGVQRPQAAMSSSVNSQYSFTFTNYAINDVINWAIEVFDTCGNISRYPDTGTYQFFFIDDVLKCANGSCFQGHNIINQFPWKEDFEGNGWIPGPNITYSPLVRGSFPNNKSIEFQPPFSQDYGWSVTQGPLRFGYSGPEGDHTTGSGKYLHTAFETQATVTNTSYILPCIDLTDSINRTLSFYYHMYGNDINSLKVKVDTSNTSASQWVTIFQLTGQQQYSSIEPWKKAILNLEPFRGKIFRLKIEGSANSGFMQTKICIDDVLIEDAPSIDMAIVKNIAYDVIACNGNSNVPITIDVFNAGYVTHTVIPVAYQLDNLQIVRDTILTSGLGFTDTLQYTFNQSLSFNSHIPHNLKLWVEIAGDTDNYSDTINIMVPKLHGALIDSFPYFLNFESSNPKTSKSPGILNSNKWSLNENKYGTSEGWIIVSGYLNNHEFGTYRGFGKEGLSLKYRSEANVNNSTSFQSNCIDLTGLLNPTIDLMIHSKWIIPKLYVREIGEPWTLLTELGQSAAAVNPKEELQAVSSSLSMFKGKKIQIAIRVDDLFPTNGISNITIDDIIIRDSVILDLAPRRVDLTKLNSGTTTVGSIGVAFTAWGYNGQNSTYSSLGAHFINACDSNAAIISAVSDSVFLNSMSLTYDAQVSFSNLTLSQPIPPGNYKVKFWMITNRDQFMPNDTFYTEVNVLPTVNLPYFNDFESCNSDFYMNGLNHQWEIGNPTKAYVSAYGGSNCAITNIDTLQISLGLDNLRSPNFSGLDTIYDAELRFDQWFNFGSTSNNYGVVQILEGGWKTLSNPLVQSYHWNQYLNPVQSTITALGFTGSSNGWIKSSYSLQEYSSPGLKSIRFLSTGVGSEGWAIDNFEIYIPPQHSGSPKLLTFNNSIPSAGLNTVSVKIENTGASPISEIDITIESQGGIILQEKVLLATPLHSGFTRILAITQPLNLNKSMQNLLVRTSLPNHRMDALPQDDSLLVPLYFLAEVDSLPSCSDFEGNQAFVSFDLTKNQYDSTWTYGAPNKTLLDSAHSGNNVWYTSDTLYGRLLNQYLYTSLYEIENDQCYRLSFWQNFDTEEFFDGGNIEFTLDSGRTWQTLGVYWSTDSLWYNTQYIQSLDGIKPGFSGNSNGWILAQNDFNVFAASVIQFRFRFASNANGSGEGWAIDDVCLEAVGSNCKTIGLEETVEKTIEAYLYPIPAKELIQLRADLTGNFHLQIFDQRGAMMKTWQQNLRSDETTSINISELPKGVYWLQIRNNKEPIVLKFIKS